LRFAVLVVLAALAGCAREQGLVLAEWTLEVPGRAPRVVRLPAHVDGESREAGRFRLHARVELPEELRDGPLCLSVTQWAGLPVLRVDGVRVDELDSVIPASYRSPGWHVWRLPAGRGSRLDLVMDVDRPMPLSGYLGAAPRLSATASGGAAYQQVRRFNELVCMVCVGLFLSVATMYGVAFALDRHRRESLWFVLQTLSGVSIVLTQSGWSQAIFGRYDLVVFHAGLAAAGPAAVYFLHATFHLGRVPRPVAWSWALLPVFAALSFDLERSLGLFAAAITLLGLCVVYCVIRLVPLLRVPDARHNAFLYLVGWLSTSVLVTPDTMWQLGIGSVSPFLFAPLALAIFSMLQVWAISRDRSVAFRRVDRLNVELREQVVRHSRELVGALAQLAPRQLAAGETFAGMYQVRRRLGAGAMGAVYEVVRTTDERRLALKVLATSGDRERWARLAREAGLAAKVAHENVVNVVDVGIEEQHGVYVVMELIEGEALEACRARFGDPRWALPLLAQLARGLAAIHARGIVHRDLKPANVMLTASGEVKIADFGLAGVIPADEGRADTLMPVGLTRTGVVMGTPSYMAPELFGGAKEAQPPADVFAFGVMAHELLSGDRPFAGPAYVPGATPRPLAVAGLPAAVHALIQRCLAGDPAARPSAVELVAGL
jgi:serine/threonine-protein kinase